MASRAGFFRKMPVILQSEAAECGLACMAMISSFHGSGTTLGMLRGSGATSLRGVTLSQLMQIAGDINLSPRALRLDVQALGQLALPSILHWNLDHFVVLESVKRDKVVIVDPAVGRRSMAISEASKFFTGVALELRPTDRFVPAKSSSGLGMRDFIERVPHLGSTLSKLFFLSMLLQAFALTTPLFGQLILDEVLASKDLNILALLAIAFGMTTILNTVIGSFRSLLMLHFGSHLQFDWAVRLYNHLIRLPLTYFERRHIGDIVSRFQSLKPIQQLATTTIVEAVIDGLMAVTTLVVMFLFSPKLAMISMAALAVYGIVRLAVFSLQRDASHEALIKSANENTHFLESIRGILAIKSFGKEQVRETAWQNKMADSVKASTTVSAIVLAESVLNQLLFGIESIFVWWMGAKLVVGGELSVGMLVAYTSYKTQFTSRTAALIDKTIEYRLVGVNLDRVGDIALTEKEVGVDGLSNSTPVSGQISLDSISFRYSPTDKNVFEGISAEIEVGQCVAIVGPSGVGKTTLLKVMMGLLEPTAGSVLIDGRAISDISLKTLRSNIASVMQEDNLLSGSLADNIAFFAEKPDMDLVRECAKAAVISDDIERMPMRYLTQVGDMGSSLSGGQKQRVLLARALYCKPKILFLDEATSHLDLDTESRIHHQLKEMNITRVLIAHRFETIAISDKVLQMDVQAMRVNEVASINRVSKTPLVLVNQS